MPTRARQFLHLCSLFVSFGLLIGCGKSNDKTGMDMGPAQQEVIQRAKEGAIIADAKGRVILSENLKAASQGGEIFLKNDPKSGLAIVFIANSSPESVTGLLYCDQSVPPGGRTIQIGASHWKVEMISDANWALVSKR